MTPAQSGLAAAAARAVHAEASSIRTALTLLPINECEEWSLRLAQWATEADHRLASIQNAAHQLLELTSPQP